MKYLSIITIVVALLTSSFIWAPANTDEPGIKFENLTFEEAIQKAKEENKLIFLDAYAVWCGPCKMMDRTTFKSEEVGKVFNKNFINIKRSEEHTSELQSRPHLVCRLLLEKKKKKKTNKTKMI